ncbi:MAG: hypothetical protein H0V44_10860 [Planctomycetes bacterium]|nr:hypothetical protein [Planctomycetota bacterium]
MVHILKTGMCAGMVALICGCGGGGGGGGSPSGPVNSEDPDLRIEDPMQMTSTTSTRIMFSIANRNTPGEPVTGVVYQVRRDDGMVVRTATIPRLEPEAKTPVEVMDNTTGRTYTVTVDPANAIPESQEANNSTTITSVPTQTVPIAGDLRFIDAHHHGAYYFQDPLFHFFIENTTGADITNVVYTIREDGADLPGYPKTIDRIAPGTPAEMFQNPYEGITPKPSGVHSYTVVIDPANAYGESNEGNNSNRSEISVPMTYGFWPGGAKPDLQFQDPHYHGPQAGRVIVFHGWFKNKHDSVATPPSHFLILRRGVPVAIPAPGPGNIGYTLDGSGKPVVQGLAPGQIVEYVVRITEPEDGDIPYSLIMDSENEVDEQHESSSADSWVNNNRANCIVVMNPNGTSG